jgi:hypothetical protein
VTEVHGIELKTAIGAVAGLTALGSALGVGGGEGGGGAVQDRQLHTEGAGERPITWAGSKDVGNRPVRM